MQDDTADSIATIGIIGGGKIGLQLLELFSASQKAKVAYVADLNPEAPAMTAARRLKIDTLTELEAALERPVDFILEVTGSERVAESLAQKASQGQCRVITHQMAYVLLTAISENNRRVGVEIEAVKSEIGASLGSIAGLVESIEDVADQMNMLAINARVEAARIGAQGKGFAVVANEIGRASESVREITRQINTLSALIAKTSAKIDRSLERLS